MATAPEPQTIVLIHGMWMTPLSWEHWAERYRGQGHEVIAPAWPGLSATLPRCAGPVAAARALDPGRDRPLRADHPRARPAADHHRALVRRAVHAAAARTAVSARPAVALDTAAPKGVLKLPLSTLRAAWPALKNPFGKNDVAPLTHEQFHWCFTNALSEADSKAVYERYYIPGSARPFFQAGYANFNPNAVTKVDYKNSARPPLLLVTGADDRIARRRSTRRPSRSSARRRARPSTRSTRAAATTPARTAGRRSPTSSWDGRSSTPASRQKPWPSSRTRGWGWGRREPWSNR